LNLNAPDAAFGGLSMNTKGVIVNFNSTNQVRHYIDTKFELIKNV
jgi:hypothetical protein